MQFSEYLTNRLDEGETNTIVQGFQNDIHTDLAHALDLLPRKDRYAEITGRSDEEDGQTLIWLSGQTDPGYSIQR